MLLFWVGLVLAVLPWWLTTPAGSLSDTGAVTLFAGVLAAGWVAGHEHALRRACAAGALSTLVPGAGDCAPYAEAIDDAVANGKARDRQR